MCPRNAARQQITRAAACLPYKALFRVMLTLKKHIDFFFPMMRGYLERMPSNVEEREAG